MVEPGHKAKPVGPRHLVAACLVGVLLFGAFEIQKHREGQPAAATETTAISLHGPEARLAAIQLGDDPDHVNSTVKRFAALLDILAADCPADSREGLADLTVKSLHQLEADGIAGTPTQVLGGVLGLTDIGSLSHCSRFFERYVAERRQQGTGLATN